MTTIDAIRLAMCALCYRPAVAPAGPAGGRILDARGLGRCLAGSAVLDADPERAHLWPLVAAWRMA